MVKSAWNQINNDWSNKTSTIETISRKSSIKNKKFVYANWLFESFSRAV